MMRAGGKNKDNNPDGEMTLSGHLREMRNRILICLIVLVVAMLIALSYSSQIVEWLLSMGRQYGYQFIYISPQELLIQYFSMSIIVGICVTLPLIFYEVYAFVRPGLKKGETVFFLFAMIFGLVCFCIGIAFAQTLMLPFMLEFLSTLNGSSNVTASISVQNYLNFIMTIYIVFGAIFELPMVSILLTQMGLMKVEWMKKAKKPMIVVIFFVAAVVTPPDIVSQVMVAIPMVALYEISIILCGVVAKFKKEHKEEQLNEEN